MEARPALLFLAVMCCVDVSWTGTTTVTVTETTSTTPAPGPAEGALGGECANNDVCTVANSYCDTSGASSTCDCVKLFTKNGEACDATVCTMDSVCTGKDANSYCPTGDGTRYCACKTTLDIDSTTDGACVAKKLGDGCTDTTNCADIDNSECPMSGTKVCTCKSGFKQVDGECTTGALGGECANNDACTVDNSYCDTSGADVTCDCVKLFTKNAEACDATVCTVDSDCTDKDANSYCPTGDGTRHCACKVTYDTASTTDGACVAKKLGDGCTDTTNCADINNSECPMSGTKVCTCKSGFKQVDGECTAASENTENQENGSGQLLFPSGLLLLTAFVMMM